MARETERETYRRLHAKYGRRPATRRRDDDEDQDDEPKPKAKARRGGIAILEGDHADAFLDRMFSPSDDEDDDDEDDDDEDDDELDDDDEPERGHPFFRRGRR